MAERIKKALFGVAILMFSMQDVPEVTQVSKLVHAQEVVTKSEDASVLLNAVDALLRGENFFPDNDRLESINLIRGTQLKDNFRAASDIQLSSGHPPLQRFCGDLSGFEVGPYVRLHHILVRGKVARWEFAIDVSSLHQMVRQRIELRRFDRYADLLQGQQTSVCANNVEPDRVDTHFATNLNCKLDTFSPA
jgi:hypothetical protein